MIYRTLYRLAEKNRFWARELHVFDRLASSEVLRRARFLVNPTKKLGYHHSLFRAEYFKQKLLR